MTYVCVFGDDEMPALCVDADDNVLRLTTLPGVDEEGGVFYAVAVVHESDQTVGGAVLPEPKRHRHSSDVFVLEPVTHKRNLGTKTRTYLYHICQIIR